MADTQEIDKIAIAGTASFIMHRFYEAVFYRTKSGGYGFPVVGFKGAPPCGT